MGSIRLRGWGSVDGKADQYGKLSHARADPVVEFLVGRGGNKDNISSTVWGPSDQFSQKDAPEKRRVENVEPGLRPWRIIYGPSGGARIAGPPLP